MSGKNHARILSFAKAYTRQKQRVYHRRPLPPFPMMFMMQEWGAHHHGFPLFSISEKCLWNEDGYDDDHSLQDHLSDEEWEEDEEVFDLIMDPAFLLDELPWIAAKAKKGLHLDSWEKAEKWILSDMSKEKGKRRGQLISACMSMINYDVLREDNKGEIAQKMVAPLNIVYRDDLENKGIDGVKGKDSIQRAKEVIEKSFLLMSQNS